MCMLSATVTPMPMGTFPARCSAFVASTSSHAFFKLSVRSSFMSGSHRITSCAHEIKSGVPSCIASMRARSSPFAYTCMFLIARNRAPSACARFQRSSFGSNARMTCRSSRCCLQTGHSRRRTSVAALSTSARHRCDSQRTASLRKEPGTGVSRPCRKSMSIGDNVPKRIEYQIEIHHASSQRTCSHSSYNLS